MRYPYGRCDRCGARLYAHVEGGFRCHNCGARYDDESGTADDSSES